MTSMQHLMRFSHVKSNHSKSTSDYQVSLRQVTCLVDILTLLNRYIGISTLILSQSLLKHEMILSWLRNTSMQHISNTKHHHQTSWYLLLKQLHLQYHVCWKSVVKLKVYLKYSLSPSQLSLIMKMTVYVGIDLLHCVYIQSCVMQRSSLSNTVLKVQNQYYSLSTT